MPSPLTLEEFVKTLDGWAGEEIAVRIVTESDDLLCVFSTRLHDRSETKRPALFWPLLGSTQHDHPEQPGIYLHPERFQGAELHEGAFVLVLRQGGVTVNLRRLH